MNYLNAFAQTVPSSSPTACPPDKPTETMEVDMTHEEEMLQDIPSNSTIVLMAKDKGSSSNAGEPAGMP
ncbi:hypothetical protein P3S67_001408 [Capsicum chacoense]